ncbi:MAG: hypothetical protein EBZ59_04065 [Planctomycetia bacterium]|nr:hypothetical protein [Planctomycetia bacterium]
MTTSLFESPPVGSGGGASDPAERYRAVGSVTIAACVLAVLSPLAFVDWWLVVVPAVAIALGVVGWRDINLRPDVLTGRPLAVAAVAVATASLVGGLSYLSLVYASELPEGFQRLDYATLQPLEGDARDTVPAAAVAMSGRNVLLKGYMYPGKQQQGIVQFLLVRDQGDCCFGGNPRITDRVLVHLADARGIPFSPRLTKIAGRFVVRPMANTAIDGGVLYHLEAAVVR